MSFQKPNIFGKSQKKSETGVTKLSTAFRAANKFSNSFTLIFYLQGSRKPFRLLLCASFFDSQSELVSEAVHLFLETEHTARRMPFFSGTMNT